MSMTAVPISMRLVRAPIAARSGNGDASCWAKWWTRKYAPSAPRSSTASASSIDWMQRVRARPHLRVGRRRPVSERQETDLLHRADSIDAFVAQPRQDIRHATVDEHLAGLLAEQVADVPGRWAVAARRKADKLHAQLVEIAVAARVALGLGPEVHERHAHADHLALGLDVLARLRASATARRRTAGQ